MKRSHIILFLISFLSISIQAQRTAWMLNVGCAELLDTYLSQEHYKGTGVQVANEVYLGKTMSPWHHTIANQLQFSDTHTRAGNSTSLFLMYAMSWRMQYDWQLLNNDLTLSAGGGALVDVGGIYNYHGGNNPSQLKADFYVMPVVGADYRFRVWKKDFHVNYLASAPLCGMTFSPQYGQSYYELFSRDNYDHNIVFTHPINYPSLNQRLTLSVPVKRCHIIVGYEGNYRQNAVNSLKYHHYTHSLLVGVSY